MNKLFNPLNEQIEVVRIKNTPIDQKLYESISNDIIFNNKLNESAIAAGIITGGFIAGSLAFAAAAHILDYKLQSISGRNNLVKNSSVNDKITVREALKLIKKYGIKSDYNSAKTIVKTAIKENTKDPHLKGGMVAILDHNESFQSKMKQLNNILQKCLKNKE